MYIYNIFKEVSEYVSLTFLNVSLCIYDIFLNET